MVNRMRATRAHRDNRRSHHALDAIRLTKDTATGSLHQRHRADLSTGMYRGKKVITSRETKPAVIEKA
jgi:large subunit ribosomal protein L32